MIELGKLLHLQGAVVWLPFTIVLYAGSSTLHRRLGKAPIANPTLLTIAALVVILVCCGVPYKAYFESVAVLHYLLGTSVVSLALPLYRNANRLHGRYASRPIRDRAHGARLLEAAPRRASIDARVFYG
jgi:putative effector of murein hydrolase